MESFKRLMALRALVDQRTSRTNLALCEQRDTDCACSLCVVETFSGTPGILLQFCGVALKAWARHAFLATVRISVTSTMLFPVSHSHTLLIHCFALLAGCCAYPRQSARRHRGSRSPTNAWSDVLKGERAKALLTTTYGGNDRVADTSCLYSKTLPLLHAALRGQETTFGMIRDALQVVFFRTMSDLWHVL